MPQQTEFTPGDLVTAHLPDGRKVEGRYWSHPRADYTAVIDWAPRYGTNWAGARVRQLGASPVVRITPDTIVHAMSVRPCHHAADAVTS